jgi:hypothetical protein
VLLSGMSIVTALALGGRRAPPQPHAPLFSDVGKAWGLTRPTVFGPLEGQKYILESTGTGVAVIDYDSDGRPDLFFVNGSRLGGFSGDPPTSMLFHNMGDHFEDVTARAGVGFHGWGQGVCIGDYDNDGFTDLYVTYYGYNVLYRNRGDGTFEERARQAGVAGKEPRWGAGCAFVDYNRDGNLDLIVANYVAYQDAASREPGSTGLCMWKGIAIMCGPRGLARDTNILYRNNGNGTFTDVSAESGIKSADGYYCFQPVTADFDEDGWPDVYVTCDSTPNILYRNNRNGTFTDVGLLSSSALSSNGNEQAGMGVAVADFDGDGRADVFVTNFSDDTPTLYKNLGDWAFSDVTAEAHLARYTQYVGWGTVFFDFDNDGWEDLCIANGHVSSRVETNGLGSFRQNRLLYRNLGDGTFEDATALGGPGFQIKSASRGVASEDFNGDGRLDLVITGMNEFPALLLNQSPPGNWLILSLLGNPGNKSNRSAIGARIRITAGGRKQTREVRSSSSFYSSNGLRVHFGLGNSSRIDELQVFWPDGRLTRRSDIDANQVLTIRE